MKEISASMISYWDWNDYKAFLGTISKIQPQEYSQYVLDDMKRLLEKIPDSLSPNVKRLSEVFVRFKELSRLINYEDMQKTAYDSFLKDVYSDDVMYMESYRGFVRNLITADAFVPSGKPSIGERFAYFKKKITPLLGDGHTMLMDIAYATMYVERFEKTAEVLTDAEKQEITAAVSHKEVAELLITESDRLQQILAQTATDNGSIIHETPQASNEKLLSTILADYKGKVVLVDFWATWCGPCLDANKKIKPLKEELSGKDVVFIYLSGETSPLATWRKMLPDIAGNHYRVSDAQWRYLGDIISNSRFISSSTY